MTNLLEGTARIPVTPENMPEDRQRVLTYNPDEYLRWRVNLHIYEACGVNDLAWWRGDSNRVVEEMNTTHWMPLPLGVSK